MGRNYVGSARSPQGGLLGLGAAGSISDRRLKQDISLVAQLVPGINVYQFRYVRGGPLRYGVMADEVEKVLPQAVTVGEDGYKRVDYPEVLRYAAESSLRSVQRPARGSQTR